MRKFLLLLAAVAAVVIAIVIVAVHRPATDQRSSTTAAPSSVPSSSSASDDRDLQELLNTRLSTTGAQLSVGLPATLTIDAANGDTVYARVTMDELRRAGLHHPGRRRPHPHLVHPRVRGRLVEPAHRRTVRDQHRHVPDADHVGVQAVRRTRDPLTSN